MKKIETCASSSGVANRGGFSNGELLKTPARHADKSIFPPHPQKAPSGCGGALYMVLYVCCGLLLLFYSNVAVRFTSSSNNLVSIAAYLTVLLLGGLLAVYVMGRLKAQTVPRQLDVWRGLVGGLLGFVFGMVVLFLAHSRRPDGVQVLWGMSMANLLWARIIFLPYLIPVLAVTGAIAGWTISRFAKPATSTRMIRVLAGVAIGMILGIIAAGVSMRMLDYALNNEYWMSLYGYYYVKCAIIIGAASGATAGAATVMKD